MALGSRRFRGLLDQRPGSIQALVRDEGVQVYAVQMRTRPPQAGGPAAHEVDRNLGVHPIAGADVGQLAQRAVVAHDLLALPELPEDVETLEEHSLGYGFEPHHLVADAHATGEPQLEALREPHPSEARSLGGTRFFDCIGRRARVAGEEVAGEFLESLSLRDAFDTFT